MESLRQVGAGILLGVISVVIVLGGLMLALAQGGIMRPATPTGFPSENTPVGELVTSFPTLPLILTDTPSGPDFTPTVSMTPPPTLINCPPPAGWVPIAIQSSDTLASLALTYRTTADLLRFNNCLLNDELISGSILYVPPQPTPTFMPCGAPLNWGYYTVVSGDTLYRIGLLYRATPNELMRANCLTTSVIRAGQVLRVPNVPTSTAPVVSPTTTPTPSATLTVTVPIVLSPTGTMVLTPVFTATSTLPATTTMTLVPSSTLTPTETTPNTPVADD